MILEVALLLHKLWTENIFKLARVVYEFVLIAYLTYKLVIYLNEWQPLLH